MCRKRFLLRFKISAERLSIVWLMCDNEKWSKVAIRGKKKSIFQQFHFEREPFGADFIMTDGLLLRVEINIYDILVLDQISAFFSAPERRTKAKARRVTSTARLVNKIVEKFINRGKE